LGPLEITYHAEWVGLSLTGEGEHFGLFDQTGLRLNEHKSTLPSVGPNRDDPRLAKPEEFVAIKQLVPRR
jgi:hypothetical protein